jgi:hypothetical protein
MKKLFLIVIFVALAFSCSSDGASGDTFSDTPLAKSQYDHSNFGIYKGVFVGSSGHILININNDGGLSATLVMEGITYNFTTSETIIEGENTEGLTFTNGSNSFDFSIGAAGYGPHISNITILGHPNAAFMILKEYSQELVTCYVGTYSGQVSGAFNIIIVDNDIIGLTKSDTENSQIKTIESGHLNNTTKAISGNFNTGDSNGIFTGNLNGNTMSGTWANENIKSGSWSCTRKL